MKKQSFEIFLSRRLALIFISLIVLTINWKPQNLLRDQLAKDIIDPNNYLYTNSNEYQDIKYLIFDIKNKHNLEPKIVIFNRMNSEYKENIELFADELAYNFAYSNKEKDYNSLIIVLAIDDRKMRIRTGKNIKQKITDYTAQVILDDSKLKNYLRRQEYTFAVNHILIKLQEKLSSDESNYITGYIFLIIVTIFLCVTVFNLVCTSCCKSRKSVSEKLEKIKKLTESKKDKKKFIEDNCIICLEEFTEQELQKKKSNDLNQENINNKNGNDQKINKESNMKEEDVIKENNQKNGEIENKNSDLKKEENIVNDSSAFSLECGHTFHKNCIADWMLRKNSCPLCKAKIDSDEDNENYKPLQQNLVDIQREFYPEIYDWTFNFSSNSFSWRNPREVVNDANVESYSSSNDAGHSNESGGATGEW